LSVLAEFRCRCGRRIGLLFKRLCVVASPSFALLHRFTDPEREVGVFGESEEARIGANDFCIGLSGAVLQKRGIPNLGGDFFRATIKA
jgi:hypothetical protein